MRKSTLMGLFNMPDPCKTCRRVACDGKLLGVESESHTPKRGPTNAVHKQVKKERQKERKEGKARRGRKERQKQRRSKGRDERGRHRDCPSLPPGQGGPSPEPNCSSGSGTRCKGTGSGRATLRLWW